MDPIFRIWSRLGPQDGPMLEAKTDTKSIRNRCEKQWNSEGLLEGHNIEKYSMLETNMDASWHQNRSRIRCYLRKAFFEKTLFFPNKTLSFGDPAGRSWEQKSIKIIVKNDARKLNFDKL